MGRKGGEKWRGGGAWGGDGGGGTCEGAGDEDFAAVDVVGFAEICHE